MKNCLEKLKTLCAYLVLIALILCSPLGVEASEQEAVFAGGCFWCLEHDLEAAKGVISVESGYAGGRLLNPTYRQHSGHQEVVRVLFDPDEISYEELLRGYWRNIDPFDDKGQFCDRGDSYRPLIYTVNEEQLVEAKKSFVLAGLELGEDKGQFKLKVKPFKKFWIAEDYHQDFAMNNSLKYSFYRYSCGRDRRLKEVWGENAASFNAWTTESTSNIMK